MRNLFKANVVNVFIDGVMVSFMLTSRAISFQFPFFHKKFKQSELLFRNVR